MITTSLSQGDRDADIFEVMLAGTLDDDIFHFWKDTGCAGIY